MSVLGYLMRRHAAAVLKEDERASIDRSIATIRERLKLNLGSAIGTPVVFGSYRRRTILPRSMDPESDIDLLVPFNEGGLKPQTYLDRLRRFVEQRYPLSTTSQSNPTVKLELNHIMFDLVPGLPCSVPTRSYLIPRGPDNWQVTEPLDLLREMNRRAAEEGERFRSAVRLLKAWNAANGYPWDSYELESWAVRHRFWGCQNFADYLFAMIDELPSHYEARWKAERVERAKRLVSIVRSNLALHYDVTAEQEVSKLIPQVAVSTATARK
jgi:predicted nucleotidyltransferase